VRDRTPRSVTLVLDENLSGHKVLAGLQAAGIPAKMQTELMNRGLPDEEVLCRLAGHPDYFLLSKDSDFHRRPAAKAALIRHGIGAFVITAHKDKTATQLVELVTHAWPRMLRCTHNHSRPFVAKILADGSVEVVR